MVTTVNKIHTHSVVVKSALENQLLVQVSVLLFPSSVTYNNFLLQSSISL